MTTFVDRVVLHVAAGNGGHGVASVKREKVKPLGGPDCGNGGSGGAGFPPVHAPNTQPPAFTHSQHPTTPPRRDSTGG